MKKFISTVSILWILLSISNCTKEQLDYESMIQQGLNSGIENNELFLDYELGMTRDDFFHVSWELNNEEKITGLVKIDYELDGLKSRAYMQFYPDFLNNRISKIPVDIHYAGWAPWNQEFSSDTLVVDLVEFYEDKFTTSFHYVFVPDLNKNAYLSVEGNRAILIYPLTEMIARVDFIDLLTLNRN